MTKRGIVTRERVAPIPIIHPPRRDKARQESSRSKQRKGTQRNMEPHDDVAAPRAKSSSSSSSSSLPQLKILRTYAKLPDTSIATALPPTVYFSHTQHTLTIFDAYPKALFHFLVLPRLSSPSSSSSASDLTDLRTLLRRRASTAAADAQARLRAEETLRALSDEAARLRGVVEEEMRTRYGFAWDVWTGFHAVPSMECVFFLPLRLILCVINDGAQTPPLARHLGGLDRACAQDETALQLILVARGVLRAARGGARVVR